MSIVICFLMMNFVLQLPLCLLVKETTKVILDVIVKTL